MLTDTREPEGRRVEEVATWRRRSRPSKFSCYSAPMSVCPSETDAWPTNRVVLTEDVLSARHNCASAGRLTRFATDADPGFVA